MPSRLLVNGTVRHHTCRSYVCSISVEGLLNVKRNLEFVRKIFGLCPEIFRNPKHILQGQRTHSLLVTHPSATRIDAENRVAMRSGGILTSWRKRYS